MADIGTADNNDSNENVGGRSRSSVTGGGFLLVGSMLWALNPLIVVLSAGSEAPFLFVSAWNFGALVSVYAYFRVFHRDLLRWSFLKTLAPTRTTFFRSFSQIANSRLPAAPFNWQILISLLTPIGGILFVLSFRFLPAVVIASVRESWPVFAALLLQFLFKEKRFALNTRTLSLFAFIFGAVVLVVLSVSSDSGTAAGLSWGSLAGLALLLGALAFNVARYLQFGWVENMHTGQDENLSDVQRSKVGHRMLFSLLAFAVGTVIGIVGSVASQQFSWSAGKLAFVAVSASVVCLGGSLCSSAGAIRARYNPRIHSVRYLTPVLAVAYLLAAGHYKGVDSTFFVLGLCAAVAGNVLVNSPAESRLSGWLPAVCVWAAGLSALFFAVAV